jgi:hypothetical protein
VESWEGIYSIEASSSTRINCLNFFAYGVLTTHRRRSVFLQIAAHV